jgi:ferredoxin
MTDNTQPVNDPKISRNVRKLIMTINQNLCIGAATCVALAPKAWALDDQAKAYILETANDETDAALLEAAKACPVAAITIKDDTGKQLFP